MEVYEKLITVGMTTHNRARFLPQVFVCFLNQTYGNFELVVLDDASSDATEQVCRMWEQKDSRIHYIRSKENQGYRKNLGRLVREAKGDYFLWAHDDDWWAPTFLEKLADAISKHPEHGVAMSWFREHHSEIYDPNEQAKSWTHDYTDKSYFFVCGEIMLRAKMNPVFIVGLFRTPFLKRLMARSFPYAKEDTCILLMEMALTTHFCSVPEVLTSKYRQPGGHRRIRHASVDEFFVEPFPYTQNTFMTLWWLLGSPHVPLHRKFMIIPLWSKLLWKYKRKIIREVASWTARLF